jgi:hypothetical protein
MAEDEQKTDALDGPPALVAIIQAARIAGDRELERAARRRLSEVFGVDLSFRRKRQEAAHA